MGDCRIRIVIAKVLLTADSPSKTTETSFSENEKTISFATMVSADTTVREVVEKNEILWQFFAETLKTSTSSSPRFRLWDCTFYPPKDITSWPLLEFPDLQGSKSKTLLTAGWFPSGTLLALPSDMTPNDIVDQEQQYVDVQFNNIQGQSLGGGGSGYVQSKNLKVEFKNPTLHSADQPLLPSHVMASVANRFEDDDDFEIPTDVLEQEARIIRRQNKEEQLQRERTRVAKLEARIMRLEEQPLQASEGKAQKNRNISDQVLRMLVKSRATGEERLKMQDRVYFQCIVFTDTAPSKTCGQKYDQGTTEYRYFSPQDTFARIASSFSSGSTNDKDMFSEVLCRQVVTEADDTSNAGVAVHRRLPITMRVYEAIAQGFLKDPDQVNTLIIRRFKDREDSTPSIVQKDTTARRIREANEPTMDNNDAHKKESRPLHNASPAQYNHNDGMEFADPNLTDALQKIDNANIKGKKSTKQMSSATLKVLQMKMKSKSKGDTKRIPKIEDRFFLEVVTVSKTGSVTSECIFLAKTDPIERIREYACIAGAGKGSSLCADSWDFLVPNEDDTFRLITTTSLATQDAEKQGLLNSYGRLILRPRQD
jgi:hypothetical protein